MKRLSVWLWKRTFPFLHVHDWRLVRRDWFSGSTPMVSRHLVCVRCGRRKS